MWHGIEGHDAAVERFRASLASGRLATTYLFVGPDGVGKRAFAMRLAQSLLCLQRADELLDYCNECDSCRLIGGEVHPDLDVIHRPEGKRYLPVELFLGDRDHRNQRGLCHNISLRPQLSSRRVAIIDDADWLTVESANCLLKTLEEPPPGALILLLGSSRNRQLPTILSRSQVVRFELLSAGIVSRLLLDNGDVVDESTATRIAQLSGGSLTTARMLADGQLLAIRGRIAAAIEREPSSLFGLAGELRELIDAAGKDAESRRRRFRQVISTMSEVLRGQVRSLCDAGHLVDHWLAAIEHCLDAEEQLDRNANQATLLESWLSQLSTTLSHAETTPTRATD